MTAGSQCYCSSGRITFLYGTTAVGGANNVGTIYKINRDGSGYTVLHNFSYAESDFKTVSAGGAVFPVAVSLVQATNGILYGTCAGGASYLLPI